MLLSYPFLIVSFPLLCYLLFFLRNRVLLFSDLFSLPFTALTFQFVNFRLPVLLSFSSSSSILIRSPFLVLFLHSSSSFSACLCDWSFQMLSVLCLYLTSSLELPSSLPSFPSSECKTLSNHTGVYLDRNAFRILDSDVRNYQINQSLIGEHQSEELK